MREVRDERDSVSTRRSSRRKRRRRAVVSRYRIQGVALARLSMSETKPTVGVFVRKVKEYPGR